jgi:hypothetical protein
MDATKILNMENFVLPLPVSEAFGWNNKLVNSSYEPMIQAEQRNDGSVSAFITTESKAILFFEDCKANGKVGRIINDEVTMTPFGDYVLVLAKASVCVDDVVKGTAVAGQTFQVGNVAEMDQCVQFASGIARSRALTNAGYGVVSGITIPAPNGTPGDPASAGSPELPFRTDNLPGAATGIPASGAAGATYAGYPVPGVPATAGNPAPGPVVSPSGDAPIPVDHIGWAKNVFWPTKGKTMGELLAMSPKLIKWAAENISEKNDIRRAAVLLYPQACHILGVAPKQIA